MLSQHIVVTTDFSAPSLAAVVAGADLLRGSEGRGTLLYVLAPPHMDEGWLVQPTSDLAEREAAARRQLEQLRVEHFDEGANVEAVVVHAPSPPQAICAFAGVQGASLIVIATHGRTGLSHFLMGSVSERVIRHAPCSVLVVR
ncbi:MAG: universal stress protein [Sandaracinaceae bacterium]|nr:universal stress protein [Sandaracinaceae bacterium]